MPAPPQPRPCNHMHPGRSGNLSGVRRERFSSRCSARGQPPNSLCRDARQTRQTTPKVFPFRFFAPFRMFRGQPPNSLCRDARQTRQTTPKVFPFRFFAPFRMFRGQPPNSLCRSPAKHAKQRRSAGRKSDCANAKDSAPNPSGLWTESRPQCLAGKALCIPAYWLQARLEHSIPGARGARFLLPEAGRQSFVHMQKTC